jgi:hypothetical protein
MINTVTIDSWDLTNAAFWLGQLAQWLDDPDHANQFAKDLWGIDEDYNPPLTVVIDSAARALTARLAATPGPNQTVTPGPNELDTSTACSRDHPGRLAAGRAWFPAAVVAIGAVRADRAAILFPDRTSLLPAAHAGSRAVACVAGAASPLAVHAAVEAPGASAPHATSRLDVLRERLGEEAQEPYSRGRAIRSSGGQRIEVKVQILAQFARAGEPEPQTCDDVGQVPTSHDADR